MEHFMCENDQFYFLRFEHGPLTAHQWELLKQCTLSSAHRERAAAWGRAFAWIAHLPRRAVTALGKAWATYVGWRTRRNAIHELRALDDRMLRDIGLHRSEIESVVYGGDLGRGTEAKVAAVVRQGERRCSGPSAAFRRGQLDAAAMDGCATR
jgi:uncharacterized protein YjiS (DUF1127 family)